MIPADLLDLLRCPESRQTLSAASGDVLARLNAGVPAGDALLAALVRADGAVAYPVRDGIPVLLVDAAIPLSREK